MSTNWQDIPRDPIADDEEIEYLYHLAEANKVIPTVDRTASVSNPCPASEDLKGRKKLPGKSRKELVREKLACIAFLVLAFPLGLASSLHLL